ncbi:MAG: hypothetical protein ACHQHN_10570 [Sphingobacteriales bacterium]
MDPYKPTFHKKWTSKISYWENVSVDEYKFIFDQAKERFEDVISENESITDKGIKIATATIALSGFFIGIAVQNHFFVNHRGFVYATSVIGVINILSVGMLLFPKKARKRGLSPDIATTDEFDNEDDKGYYLQKLYYNSIAILQNNIDLTIIANESRISKYKIVLISFALFVAAVSAGIAMII